MNLLVLYGLYQSLRQNPNLQSFQPLNIVYLLKIIIESIQNIQLGNITHRQLNAFEGNKSFNIKHAMIYDPDHIFILASNTHMSVHGMRVCVYMERRNMTHARCPIEIH